MSEEKNYFIENLAILINAGIGVLPAIETLKAEARRRGTRRFIDRIKEDIDAGFSLWQALDKTKKFPSYVISLIRLGENSGYLKENLAAVALEQQKNRIYRLKIRSAMLYPALILFMTALVGAGIVWFVLPRLALVFSQLRIELPVLTKALISAGSFLEIYGANIIPLFILTVSVVAYFIFSFPKTKSIGQFLLFNIPGAKKIIQEVELARFGYALGTLLKAGLPIAEAIGALKESSSFYAYRKFYIYLENSIEEGNSFKKSFALYSQKALQKLIPISVQQMIVSAEQSGQLTEVFLKIGETFEIKVDNTAKNLIVILEPFLLIIVWFGVVMLALAIILPIYSLIGGVNR